MPTVQSSANVAASASGANGCGVAGDRLGRHGKVFLTIPSQSTSDEQKFIQKGEALGTDSLFDIDPKDIAFFVGGVPPNVTGTPPPTAVTSPEPSSSGWLTLNVAQM